MGVNAELTSCTAVRFRRHSPAFAPEQSVRSAGAPKGAVNKVLIVDDEIDVADLASILLGDHGFETLVAHSAPEALQLLGENSDIKAVFTDVMMPGMSGLELAKVVEESYPGVKVILTSGFTSLALSTSHPSYRLFVAKPYRIERIVELLSS